MGLCGLHGFSYFPSYYIMGIIIAGFISKKVFLSLISSESHGPIGWIIV